MERVQVGEWPDALAFLEERAGKTVSCEDMQTLCMQFPEHVAELLDRREELNIETTGEPGL
jgi:hypothetical protein